MYIKGNASVYEIEPVFIELKKLIESNYNDVMVEERADFLKNYAKGENRGCGFRSRTLMTTSNQKLNLLVPRVRNDSKLLEFSIFDRYKRGTKEFEAKIEYFYIQDIYEKHITDVIEMSCITHDRKKKIRSKFLREYRAWLEEHKKGYEVLKLDATEFNKKYYKTDVYTLYSIWGYKRDNEEVVKKCLGFHVQTGKENSEGWKITVEYIKDNVDLTNTKLIVSDMNYSLKKQLETLDIPLQNCLWHRLDSITKRVVIKNKEKKKLKYDTYDRIRTVRNSKTLKRVLGKFSEYDFQKRSTGQCDYNRMLSTFFHDNFTYLNNRSLIKKYGKKLLMQSMDIESRNSGIKDFMKRYSRVHSKEILEFRVYCYLKSVNLL